MHTIELTAAQLSMLKWAICIFKGRTVIKNKSDLRALALIESKLKKEKR